MKCLHDVEHVIGQLAVRAVGTAALQCVGHIGHTQAAILFGIAMRQRHFTPLFVARFAQFDRTTNVLGSGTLSEPKVP